MKPKVLLVGGPDIDARLDLMDRLSSTFHIAAVGTEQSLTQNFKSAGYDYFFYKATRGINPINDLKSVIALVKIFREQKPHIVHTFDTKPGVWGRLAARLAGVSIVVGTLPGLGALYSQNSWKTAVIRAIYQPLQKISCSLSESTIFQNNDDHKQFINQRIVKAEKSTVILSSGLQTKIYHAQNIDPASTRKVREEFNISSDGILVTMITRLLKTKGVLEFGEAAKTIKKSYPNVFFLLVGGLDTSSLDAVSEDEILQLQDHVVWAGKRHDIPKILAASDIFTLPSYYREGVPRVLIEAAAMSLPLVTTDWPGCNETVENERNGYLIPIRDPNALTNALTKLIAEPKKRKQFGAASRKRAIEKFDLQHVAQQTAGLYQNLLEQNSGISATQRSL